MPLEKNDLSKKKQIINLNIGSKFRGIPHESILEISQTKNYICVKIILSAVSMLKQLHIFIALAVLFAVMVTACSNSECVEGAIETDFAQLDYLPLDDSEYPYAGIPRIVIVTENFRAIKDRETEIPAKLQIWGEKAPESEIMDLTIRGRGNSSWTEMPKNSYKIEFINKQAMLGMPKDRDWALIANYADKTLMRNFITYRLASSLGTYYSPKCEFAELFLNKEYLGIYLVTETIKIAKNRVNIPKNDYNYIVEVDGKYKDNEQVVFSNILTTNGAKKTFKIHEPKNASPEVLDDIQQSIENFESFLKTIRSGKDNHLEEWIDIDESIKYYWIQEFSKNPDTGVYDGFLTSVYFSFAKDGKIKMGPVWDFDLAYGNHSHDTINLTENWHVKKYWYKHLLKDEFYYNKIQTYWVNNRNVFETFLDSISIYENKIKNASKNNFCRWKIMKDSTSKWHRKSYNSYEDAVDDLKTWITQRIKWIDSQLHVN